MSEGYAKLFGSILSSTIWLEEHHVVRVWIAMLAMKTRDGIVEAAIPGLAHAARVTVPECEEALAKFLAPDPYSRTKDHEGRRIAEVDGGWEVLNHDKYRDKLDREDQLRKDAERQQRRRDKLKAEADSSGSSRSVTDRHAESRRIGHADPDLLSLDQGSDLTGTEPPDLGEPRVERDQAPTPAIAPPGIPTPGTTSDPRVRLNTQAWQYAAAEHLRLKGTGISPLAKAWHAWPVGAAKDDLVDRTREVLAMSDPPDFEAARVLLKARIDVAVAEAVREQHLDWFTPMLLWRKESFWRAAETTPAAAAQPRSRAGPVARGTPANPDEIRHVKTFKD